MKRRLLSKKGWIAVVPAVLLIVVLGVGGAQQTVPELCSPLTQLYQYIDRSFYWQDKLQDTTLLHGAMRGMVEALDDPYSEFLDPQEWTRFVDSLEGKLTGVGIEIAIVKNVLTVVAPLEGTPAEAAGIKAGDQILAIDGQTAEGITTSQASSKIRGEAGTTVVLHIRHKDGKEEDISIVRQEISVPAVRSELVDDGRIGYIRLSRFDSDAATEVNRALQSFDLNGLDGLILDLRNNTGGYTVAAVEVSSYFVDDGTIYSVKDTVRGNQTFSSIGNRIPNLPLAVLINGGTASAAEITAGAIHDHEMGILIGQKTFGKGVQQSTQYHFPDGSVLKLTTGEFFTPLGHVVHGVGIAPDIVVPEDGDPREAAITWIHEHLGSRMPLPLSGTGL